MGEVIWSSLENIFGSGLVDSLVGADGWLTNVFSVLNGLFNGSSTGTTVIGAGMTVFSGIACALLLVYFYMDLMGQASRDMFTFEKLVVAFIKLFIAFSVLINLEPLVKGMVDIGYKLMSGISTDSTIINALGTSTDTSVVLSDSLHAALVDEYGETMSAAHPIKLVTGIGFYVFQWLFIVDIVGFAAKLIAFFLATSNALGIIVRGLFAPIAVVQLFEDGTRSAGVRYIKKFCADCVTMALMVVILLAANALSTGLIADMITGFSGTAITLDYLRSDVLKLGNLAKMLVPTLAAVGGMAGANKIAHDIFGVG